ncbi:hypothetical protein AN189_07415 [Loktanella sp. 3ANDIMAR09]|uniref:YqaJ viral recombinase family nuclease n=1 Tax=Loktanella sp. 3ANDIMAR09 TaxID=1225657 RepID=UPI0006F9EE57|nr:YqaJ viral recombinase family protein [Loktanella sp. 3ANDIMAR09]KQI68719.1 hypothetical protein AN189_07415 [Loktanella sp. 3ANDIMAR09]
MGRIEAHYPKTRDAWHALRAKDVTASVVGALFGAHEYTTRFELWHQKAGNLTTAREETAAMRRGTLLEPVAVAMLADARPDWRISYSTSQMVYFRDAEVRLGATPDLIVDCPQRGRGTVQIKTCTAGDFAKKWRGDDGEPEAPLWINLQTEVERYLTNSQWAAVAVLTLDTRAQLEIEIVDVPRVDGVISSIKGACRTFWADVASGLEPDPDFTRDADVISAAYPAEDPEKHLDLTTAADIETLISEAQEASRQRQEADARLKSLRAEIKHRMGDADTAHLSGGRQITLRTEHRPGAFTGPSKFRRLRLPRAIQQ